MVELEVYENHLIVDISRKGQRCENCGSVIPCMYMSPTRCRACDVKMVDALGLIVGIDIFEEKLLFHKAKTLSSRRPTYLTGIYDD